MQKVAVEDIEPRSYGSPVDRRGLSDPLGTTDVAINHYRLGSGERLAGLHTHVDQEEVFVVVDGEAAFETLNGEVSIGEGEAIRFAPGEYQSATNDSGDEVEIIALGAPKGTEDWRVPLPCSDCRYDNMRPTVADDGATPVLECPDCESRFSVECSECGSDDKQVILADDGETPLDVCMDCGAQTKARYASN